MSAADAKNDILTKHIEEGAELPLDMEVQRLNNIISRMQLRIDHLVTESKESKGRMEKFEHKVFALEDDLADKQRKLEDREKFIKLFGTHLLNKRLGKLGLHNQNQKGYREYKELVHALDGHGMLYKPHAGAYSQRIVRPEKIYRFDEYMDRNWRKHYKIRVDQYADRVLKFRR